MSSLSATLTFNNGFKIPVLGLGTWKSETGKVTQAVIDAIDFGYRHIDCAYIYGNEKEVGAGLKQKFNEGKVRREDMFITSKLWNTFHRADLVEPACQRTLDNLGLKYLDLYLIHWPMAYKDGDDVNPKKPDGSIIYSDASYLDTWEAMENLVQKGLVKSIGVSNFNENQLCQIINKAKICPVTNQVECHPYLNQKKLQAFCAKHDILLTAYSPLGSPDRPWASETDPILLKDPVVIGLASKYKKTPAQILIKYQIQNGNIVIPKSVTKERIIMNAQVFDFAFDEADMSSLNSLNRGLRYCGVEWSSDHKDYPFKDEVAL